MQPILNPDKEPESGFVTLATEVTAQVRARQHLVESEGRFRNMIEQSPVAIALTRGEEFIFESINPLMLRILQKTNQEEVLGKSLLEIAPEFYSQPLFKVLLNVLNTGQTFK